MENGGQEGKPENPDPGRVPSGSRQPDPYARYRQSPSPGVPYAPPVRRSQLRELNMAMRGGQVFLRQAATAYLALMSVVIVVLVNIVISYDGALSLIAWALSATILPAMAVCIAAVVGSPIRLIPAVRRWWIRNGEISVAGLLAGWGFTVYSFLSSREESGFEEGIHYTARIPNWDALLLGWWLLAFFMTHLWLPARWRRSRSFGP